jgi:hypothetical protein
MKKEYLPYYISRALLSAVFAVLINGFTWIAALVAVIMFGLFLLYLHSGWFKIDVEKPLMPLRRDTRGQDIQRKALIAAVVTGMVIYLSSTLLPELIGISTAGNIALAIAILTYFLTQFILLARN